jgi:hypothetical protein
VIINENHLTYCLKVMFKYYDLCLQIVCTVNVAQIIHINLHSLEITIRSIECSMRTAHGEVIRVASP